jgi:hypothetical protein
LADLTGNVKWVDIIFQVDDKKIILLFVELSGGIDSNSSKKKRRAKKKYHQAICNVEGEESRKS